MQFTSHISLHILLSSLRHAQTLVLSNHNLLISEQPQTRQTSWPTLPWVVWIWMSVCFVGLESNAVLFHPHFWHHCIPRFRGFCLTGLCFVSKGYIIVKHGSIPCLLAQNLSWKMATSVLMARTFWQEFLTMSLSHHWLIHLLMLVQLPARAIRAMFSSLESFGNHD